MDDAGKTVRGPGQASVSVQEAALPPLQTLRLLETDAKSIRAASAALGFDLPETANRLTEGSPQSVRLGPGEWLVRGGSAADIAARLHAIVHHVSEVGPGRVGWRISGSDPADLIAAGCSIDLHPRAFPPGACTRTLLAQAGIVLSRPWDGDGFEIIADRSLGHYLSTWLQDAA